MTQVFRMRTFTAIVIAWSIFAATAYAELPRVRVLFLGDNGHHVPAEFAAILVPAMQSHGIDITYTDRLDDLNAQTLAPTTRSSCMPTIAR